MEAGGVHEKQAYRERNRRVKNAYINNFLVHTQILISGKFVSQQYVLYSFIFSPLHMVINEE